jgi:hypothetical protein
MRACGQPVACDMTAALRIVHGSGDGATGGYMRRGASRQSQGICGPLSRWPRRGAPPPVRVRRLLTAPLAFLGFAQGDHAIGATMPFSKYNIDPEHIEAMRAAFDRVCDILQLDCRPDDPMTEVVVTRIVERAKAGELDLSGCASRYRSNWSQRRQVQ